MPLAPAAEADLTGDSPDLSDQVSDTPGIGRRRVRPGAAVWAWLRSDRRAAVAVGYLVVLVVASILAPLFTRDPLEQDLESMLAKPGGKHWLGTEDLGRDVLSRLVAGAQVSLRAAGTAVLVATLLGITVGVLAGFLGGLVDDVVMRLTDAALAFPALVLAIGVVAMLGPGLNNAMAAVGIVFAPAVARLARSQVLKVKETLYVDASHTFGASNWQIIRRDILPNAMPAIVVQLAMLFSVALLAEAGLSFIGLGVQPPDPSWGSMLGRAYKFMDKAPQQIVIVGLVIMTAAIAFNTVGDSLRDHLDPRRRRGRA